MRSCLSRLLVLTLALLPAAPLLSGEKAQLSGITVDKSKRTVTIACTIAPRKLPNLKQIYPIEVIATFPAPRGQKAHETVVNFEAKPSDIHKALVGLGLKAGKPALGEMGPATGPEVKIYLEFTRGGETVRVPIEETMVDLKTGQTLPKQKWLFTGSTMTQPDPEKDDTVYGADLTGTLITIFPVTNSTVFQTALSGKDEANWKLETNQKLLPKIGTAAKLIIQAK
jgi:hypothetical protein